ncbi:MAG: carboxypeptidase M32 [Acidobacteriota bacterium]
MKDQLDELKSRLAGIVDLRAASALMSWDQETYMPPGSIEARAAQLATVGRLAHELFTSDGIADLLAGLADEVTGLHYDSDDASLIRVTRREFDKATRIPTELVAAIARESALAQHAWQEARSRSEFKYFRPHLEKLVALNVEKAEALGYEDRLYDPLLDQYEPEMTAAEVERAFSGLEAELVPLVQAIAEAAAGSGQQEFPFLYADYGEQEQWDFGVEVMRDFGFDFERGRQDRSAHPFTTSFSINDVRLTTRIQRDFLPSALFGSLHECGHGLYEQGVAARLDRTPLAGGASLSVHESQSRLWENLVGRSRGFWSHYYPHLKARFPGQLGDVDEDCFYRAINQVRPSLIRVEADEVTYNLHIILRFELENALLEGALTVADLPEAWNAKIEHYLGLVPGNDAEGVLQDIHWSMGAFGYFPTYTLGNLISSQLFDRAQQELSGLDQQIASGHFRELLHWLREKVHQHGQKYAAAELLDRIVGQGLAADSWLRHIRRKYSELYACNL